ncbi:unnamed protein product [Clavelina lepadiformis]|uniref:DUF4200 domain-containing protein n=1 Tax=Clavelina lepadiformis TaxID=159417 RepID=A0ABP0F668_CLALP
MPLATSNHSGAYQLNLEPQKKNVFVTQLNDRQHDEDDDIRRFAVVKESADQLLQTGINTLQKTSLLRKAIEVEQIDAELAEKRDLFRKRMAANKTKEEALKRKQEKIKERVGKFDRFLKENEAKRTRALRKYQIEVRENKIKAKDLVELKTELERLSEAKNMLMKKLESHKKFETYLMHVIDALPEDYLEMTGENMIQSVIQRHEGLSATYTGLLARNSMMTSEIESGQRELDMMKQERNNQKMVINSQMADLQKYQEQLVQRNRRLEQQAGDTTISHRTLVGELGRISMAIDNLADVCHARHWPPLSGMSYIDKLTMIQQHFREQQRVQKLVQKLRESRPITSSVEKGPQTSHTSAKEDVQLSTIPKMPAIAMHPKPQRRSTKSGFWEHLKTITETE